MAMQLARSYHVERGEPQRWLTRFHIKLSQRPSYMSHQFSRRSEHWL